MSGIVDQLDDLITRRDAAFERCLAAPINSTEAATASAEWDRLQAGLWALAAYATSEELVAAVSKRGSE